MKMTVTTGQVLSPPVSARKQGKCEIKSNSRGCTKAKCQNWAVFTLSVIYSALRPSSIPLLFSIPLSLSKSLSQEWRHTQPVESFKRMSEWNLDIDSTFLPNNFAFRSSITLEDANYVTKCSSVIPEKRMHACYMSRYIQHSVCMPVTCLFIFNTLYACLLQIPLFSLSCTHSRYTSRYFHHPVCMPVTCSILFIPLCFIILVISLCDAVYRLRRCCGRPICDSSRY
jgi:hypothetical protein